MIWIILGKTAIVLCLLLALALSLIGFAGSVVAFITAWITAWITGFTLLTGHTLFWLAVMMGIAETVEVLSGTIGARTFQASRQAVIGSVIGLIVGCFLGLITFQFYLLFFGLIAGTLVGELVAGRRDPGVIIKSIVGVVIGKVGGILVKSGITLAMVVVILVHVFR